MKKQLLSIILALLPMLAMADANGSCGTNVTYTFVSSTGTLTIQGSGAMRDYSSSSSAPWYSYKNDIKTVIIEDGVTSIGSHAFSGCSSLTSVTIPNSVTSIGSYAFWDCSGLTSVTIPNSVTSIGEGAFDDCSGLTSVIIPNSVTSIGGWAFCGCSGLTSVIIGNSVTSIGERAFYNCSGLTSVTIGNSVTSIGVLAFYGCSGLTSITVAQGNTKYDSRENCNAIIETTSNTLIAGCKTTIIPNGVTSIGQSAFNGCSGLTSINIPNSVTSIGSYAFLGCGLTSITISNNVASIGDGAFSRCTSLASLTIPSSVTSVGDFAFAGLNLTSMTINKSDCSLMYRWFGDGVDATSIGNIIIGANVSSVCGEINSVLGLESILVDANNTKYDSRNDCNAVIETATNTLVAGCKNSVIPDNVVAIGKSAFYKCSGLTTITIPNSVTSIGQYAFSGCSGLTSVTIGNSVTSIGEYAFHNCSGLQKVIVPDIAAWCGISFGYDSANPLSYAHHIYSDENTEITDLVIPDGVTSIGNYAFRNCSGLTSVTIPNSVTSIGIYAFYGCSSLTSVKSKIETPFAFGSIAFYGISNDCVLTVPYGTRDAYIAAGWTEDVFKGGVVENDNVAIAMKTGSGADRTMIGYSSQYNLDFTGINDVKAYIVIGFTDTKGVLMARVNIVPANTGIVLKSDVAGVEVEVPTTTSDMYYANLLKPAVNNVTIYPTEDIDAVNYTNLMVGTLANEQMGFVTLPSSKAYSNKSYLQIPTEFYNGAASAREGGLEMEFVDTETTDIRSLMHNGSATNDAYYDLQGRKVTPVKKGIYIKNGKKVIVK